MEIFPETGQSHGKDFGRVEDYGLHIIMSS